MKSLLLFISFMFISAFVGAQSFPDIETESLTGKTIRVPGELGNKPRVIGLAFSKEAQKDMGTWITPIYRQFIDEQGLGTMIYDVETYMLVVFTGAKRAAAKKATKMIKSSTDVEFHDKVLLHKGKFSTFKDNLNISDKDSFYLFIVSSSGDVMYYVTGRYTEKKFDKIHMVLE